VTDSPRIQPTIDEGCLAFRSDRYPR
jgi:hypothetical protein